MAQVKGQQRAVEEKARWVMGVREMPHKSGITFPVFEWTWQSPNGMKGGELRIWPQGNIVFKSSRESEEVPYDFDLGIFRKTVEAEDSDLHGFGEPPHLEEVFQAVSEAKKKFPAKSKKNTLQIFEELRQKLAAIAAS